MIAAPDADPVILVVDDDPTTCHSLATLLERDGHQTRIATSGAECLHIVRREPIALVLLDIVMPGMNGFAVCRALHAMPAERRPSVILLTGYDGLAMRRRGIRHGICEFLTKPIDPDILLGRVRRQLHVVALARGLARLEHRLDGRP